AALIENDDRHVAAHRDEMAFGVAHDAAVAELHRALIRGFQEGLVGNLRRAAHVEGTHGELRARLADRLRRDDAHGLADIDRRAAREVASVADRADPDLDVAGQRRADADRLDAGLLDRLDVTLADKR